MNNERWREEMKAAMTADRVDEFHDYGCHFHGKLVVVRCPEQIQRIHPRSGQFGSMSCLDVGDVAMQLIAEKGYDVEEKLLAIPDVVVRVK